MHFPSSISYIKFEDVDNQKLTLRQQTQISACPTPATDIFGYVKFEDVNNRKLTLRQQKRPIQTINYKGLFSRRV